MIKRPLYLPGLEHRLARVLEALAERNPLCEGCRRRHSRHRRSKQRWVVANQFIHMLENANLKQNTLGKSGHKVTKVDMRVMEGLQSTTRGRSCRHLHRGWFTFNRASFILTAEIRRSEVVLVTRQSLAPLYLDRKFAAYSETGGPLSVNLA